MLEKPDLPDEQIIARLQAEYGLPIARLTFLPLGADLNTAVYRAVAADGTPYFVKLRRGPFDEIIVALPKFYAGQGIPQIIAPLPTQTGHLWAGLDPFNVILYPFVEGRDAYQVSLSDRHWVDFGAALKRIHTAPVPPALISLVPPETYSPSWRQAVRAFLARVEHETFDDPIAARAAAFLQAGRGKTLDLVARAERLALALQARAPEFIVCHSDLHAGNLHIGAGGALYIVDWDNPVLAPKERDLMYVGGGLAGAGHTPQQEEALFYQGYGLTPIDPVALAYYRYERIVQDIAVECELIFGTNERSQDREQSLHWLISNFLPDNVLEIADKSDQTLRSVLIETARLILRTVTMEDVADVALSWNLDGGPIPRQEAERQVTWMLENHRQNAPGRLVHLCLVIVHKESRQFIGWCGLDHRDQAKPAPVLFYLLQASHWGQGLATEAARAVLDYAFRELGLVRVDSAAAFDNIASRRVMEKIGMRYIGLDEEGGYSFTLTIEEYDRICPGFPVGV